ncbi:transposase [Candidatus Micrarchaeota archaeon]|nr:transposase [Candidatus Micrarchaeota archaeon]
MRSVVQCGIVALTNIKQDALDTEYDNLQKVLKGEDAPLYSANKQQAFRFYKRKKLREYPLSIRNDLLKIEIRDTKIAEFWVRLPVKKIRGGMWVAVKPHKPIDLGARVCESKIIRRKGKYQLHLVLEKEVVFKKSYSNILAIDLGSRNVATSVAFSDGHTTFYGRDVRKIRGHFFHLRRKLGEKKALKTIKKIGRTEQRKVNDCLHKISRNIVDYAKKTDSLIVLGILQNVRKRKGQWRKKSTRKVNSMPSFKLSNMIRYKAEQEGLLVVETYEGFTSRICNRCIREGNRRTQGLFECSCGYSDNADRNGAINIGKRLLGNLSSIGAYVDMPEPKLWQSMTLEATYFNRC